MEGDPCTVDNNPTPPPASGCAYGRYVNQSRSNHLGIERDIDLALYEYLELHGVGRLEWDASDFRNAERHAESRPLRSNTLLATVLGTPQLTQISLAARLI